MIKCVVVFALLFAAGVAYADDYKLGNIAIGRPWARPTAQGVKIGAAYLSLENKGSEADKLVSAASPVAANVQIHQTTNEGGVMKMHEARGGVELAPGATIAFKPGGYHIMLLDLKQKLEEGQRIPLTLTFTKAGSINVEVDVEKTSGSEHSGGPMQDHGMTGLDHKMH